MTKVSDRVKSYFSVKVEDKELLTIAGDIDTSSAIVDTTISTIMGMITYIATSSMMEEIEKEYKNGK